MSKSDVVNDLIRRAREIDCGTDTIYYRLTDDGTEIMAIPGKQDIAEWL